MRTRNRANQKVGQSGPNKECRAQSNGGELYDFWCRVAPWIFISQYSGQISSLSLSRLTAFVLLLHLRQGVVGTLVQSSYLSVSMVTALEHERAAEG